MKYYNPVSDEIGKSVFDILSEKETMPDSPCGGKGICGKCRMHLSGELTPPDEEETVIVGKKDIDRGIRLACRAKVLGPFSYEGISEIKSEIETASIFDSKNIISDRGSGMALAVDLGTTTVALYLIDLSASKTIRSTSFLNPQRIHGADVISRINFAREGGAQFLRDEIVSSIAEEAKKLYNGEYEYAVICGNTVMEHFLTGRDASKIAVLPFTPDSLFGYEEIFSFCRKTYLAPCVASYVGGDIVMGACAASLDKADKLTLYIDVGTNGEIVLASPGRLLCCAAAAGPAFEGANIECGMTARPGAISRVWSEGQVIKYETIGNQSPLGICGSGLIDACAVMLELEMIDETGRLNCDKYYFDKDRNIYISGKDIRQLQLSKAAIAAGFGTLLDKLNYTKDDVSITYLAGGFGTHINPNSAKRIGLIPDSCDARSLGNCAGAGAVFSAISSSEIKYAENLCRSMEYIELSTDSKFNELYIEEMMFE